MDLIDRKKLIEECAWTLFDCSEVVDVDDILKFPTIEAEPIKHGKWVQRGTTNIYSCSECKFEKVFYGVKLPNYCDICGARMDERM